MKKKSFVVLLSFVLILNMMLLTSYIYAGDSTGGGDPGGSCTSSTVTAGCGACTLITCTCTGCYPYVQYGWCGGLRPICASYDANYNQICLNEGICSW